MPGMLVQSNPMCRYLESTKVIADRTGDRFYHMVLWWGCSIIGYIVGLTTSSVGGRYVALFLMTSGYTGNPKSSYNYTRRSLTLS